jgi:ankyrin repeat protein
MGGYHSKRRKQRRQKIQDLFVAARDNDVERVSYLLNHSHAKISPEVSDGSGRDALYWATLAGNLKIVRVLLKAEGANKRNYCRIYNFGAPKHYGSANGTTHKVKTASNPSLDLDLLEKRYMERCRGVTELPHSATIMHVAIIMGRTRLVRELLDRKQYWFAGYIRELRNTENQRPIDLAYAINDDELISILNEAGSSLLHIRPIGMD